MKKALPSISDLIVPQQMLDFFSTREAHFPALAVDHTEDYLRGPKNIRSWSEKEDALLTAAVEVFQGKDIRWEVVAKGVPTRNMKQCRERWEFHLNPGIKKDPFEQWEDDLIIAQQHALGNRWTVIAEKLPGRTSSAVKNRWYTVLKKVAHRQHQRRSGGVRH